MDIKNKDLFCSELPTHSVPENGKILVTGASGYIGGLLLRELPCRGYQVRAMVRGDVSVYQKRWPGVEVVKADVFNINSLDRALENIHTAYYLIHSLYLGGKYFQNKDTQAAKNFRIIAAKKKIKHIIYLGGLGDVKSIHSLHLKNRIKVAEELRQGDVPVTFLRAAIIIGSGSASYEIIHHLVLKLPVFFMPKYAKNWCQPIAIRDVIKYLIGTLETPEMAGKSFDIGGKNILTYEDMLKSFAKILNKKIFFIYIPFSYLEIYSYVVSLITPVPSQIVSCLLEGLKDEVVCCDDNKIKTHINFETLRYKEAIVRALTREEQDKIHTRWSDAYPPAHTLAIKLHELKEKPVYKCKYSIISEKSSNDIFNSLCRVGGKTGWFNTNWMWHTRGLIDSLLLGVGTIRGRKAYSNINVNDVVDFWRVEAIEKNSRLLLRAEMKIPGKAWLEFEIIPKGRKNQLSVIAYFSTCSLFGKLYWYFFLPFHHFIFTDLLKQIEKKHYGRVYKTSRNK